MSGSIGLYGTISQDQLIASCKMQLKIETSDDDLYLLKLANEAVRHMDSLSVFIKRQCTLDICDGKAKLPNGFYRLLGLRLNGSFNCASLYYIDQPFLTSCDCATLNGFNIFGSTGIFQIQNGYIVFGTTLSSTDPVTLETIEATTVECAFIGMNVDENGLMVVREDMERGVVAYMCYMYGLQNPERYNQYIIDTYRGTWEAQKAWIKSNDVQNAYRNTKRQISAIANEWISDKNWWI